VTALLCVHNCTSLKYQTRCLPSSTRKCTENVGFFVQQQNWLGLYNKSTTNAQQILNKSDCSPHIKYAIILSMHCCLFIGYSAHMLYEDFLREFQILQPCGERCQTGSKKVVIVHVLSFVIYTTSTLGLSPWFTVFWPPCLFEWDVKPYTLIPHLVSLIPRILIVSLFISCLMFSSLPALSMVLTFQHAT